MKKIMNLLVALAVISSPVSFQARAQGAPDTFGSPASKKGAGGVLSLQSYLRKPKLVVVLVIDQFRADYLTRFQSRFLRAKSGSQYGGFKYLMSQGAYFPFARYELLQSMTAVGHATVLTGAYPFNMGISLNEWYDRATGGTAYCVDDPQADLIGATGVGVSPRRLRASTVGDELKNAGYGGKSVSIALKDRAAVLLAGHRADFVFWLDKSNFNWVSSKFYLPGGELPSWVTEINKTLSRQKGSDVKWVGQGKETGLSNAFDSGKFERKAVVGSSDSQGEPFGVQITTDLALAAVKNEQLGRHTHTDMLTVSFSSHDILGHKVGPNAREMEELTVAEDQQIARLINAVAKQTPGGIKDVVFVLTGDHGVSPYVPLLQAAKFDSDYFNEDEIIDQVEAALSKKFGAATEKQKWVLKLKSLNLYLNRPMIEAKKVSLAEVQKVTKQELAKVKGVFDAVSSTDIEEQKLPPAPLDEQIKHNYLASQNGDLVIIPQPYYMDGGNPATHITGYNYDTNVPVIIAGPHLKPGVYSQAARVIDIAPTLSFLLGVLPPSLSQGRVLSEAIGD